MRIEIVAFKPVGVIHKRAVAAKLGHENLVSQALGRAQVARIAGQPQDEVRVLRGHAFRFILLAAQAVRLWRRDRQRGIPTSPCTSG